VQLQEGEITFIAVSAYWIPNCISPIVMSQDAFDKELYGPNITGEESLFNTLWTAMDFPQNESSVGNLYFASGNLE
jgi:hypothetical protein